MKKQNQNGTNVMECNDAAKTTWFNQSFTTLHESPHDYWLNKQPSGLTENHHDDYRTIAMIEPINDDYVLSNIDSWITVDQIKNADINDDFKQYILDCIEWNMIWHSDIPEYWSHEINGENVPGFMKTALLGDLIHDYQHDLSVEGWDNDFIAPWYDNDEWKSGPKK